MYIFLTERICEDKYTNLMNLMLKMCDEFCFRCTNQGKDYTYKNKNDFYQRRNDGEFIRYMIKLHEYFSAIQNCNVGINVDYKYLQQEYDVEMYIFSVKINKSKLNDLKNFLSLKSDLCDWCYPDAPEDLCFFQGGRCILETIAHEGFCYIYDVSIQMQEALYDLGISFYIREGNDIYYYHKP